MRLMPIVRLAAVWLATMILTASVRAGAPSLDQEAEAEAHKYLRTILTPCGEDYVSKHTIPTAPHAYMIEQYHQLTTTMTPTPLTIADTLNGIEWHGTVAVSASANREFPHGLRVFRTKLNTWTEWQAMNPDPRMEDYPGVWAGLRFSLVKQQGQWTISGRSEPRQAPDCATIPPSLVG
jgi:hypothetical protein